MIYQLLNLTLVACVAIAVAAPAPATPAPADPYEEANASWDRFGAVYSRVMESYYARLDQAQIMHAAIEGVLKRLDQYSQYYDQDGLRQLRQDTSGKFAGLGITVGIKDHYPVVISPIDGTPAHQAGMRPGDLIVGIEGQNTYGMPLEKVVNTLRGEPGSKVQVRVVRKGGPLNWDLTLERQIIKIESVVLCEEIRPGIGYISMRQTRFSEDTGREMEQALQGLRSRGVKGVILDLRGNPGGLLSQAAEVADLFLSKGAPIVSIRDRAGQREEIRNGKRKPIAEDLPLVVLIDGGSASASEIVAGAVQDNDRGLIVGTTSFGKGSVQTIYDLPETGDGALKLTTALYYTPSGRNIHRESLPPAGSLLLQVPFGEVELPAALVLDTILRAADRVQAVAELRARFDLDGTAAEQVLKTSLADLVAHGSGSPVRSPADSLGAKSTAEEVFRTQRGRTVYGGGGIAPDIAVEPEPVPGFVLELERHRMFFDFAVDLAGIDSLYALSPVLPEVDGKMLDEFRDFVSRADSSGKLLTAGHRDLASLRKAAGEAGWSGQVAMAIDSLGALLARERGGFTARSEPFIKAAIKRELALRLQGKRRSLVVGLEGDLQVQRAVELLQDSAQYNRLLKRSAS